MIVIDEAGNGRELLEKLETVHPDLVIVDISMPQMGGLEAAVHIKRSHPGVKIVILTMHRDKEFLERAMEIGVA